MKKLTKFFLTVCLMFGLWPNQANAQYCDSFPLPPIVFSFTAGCGDTSGQLCASMPGFSNPDLLVWAWPGIAQGQCITANVDSIVYTVRVSEPINGCSAVATFTTAYKPPIVLSPTVIHPRCGDSLGSIQVNHTGGTGPLNYFLVHPLVSFTQSNPLFDSLSSGAYKVVATDIVGCTASVNVQLDTTSAPVLSLVTSGDASCGNPNGSALLTTTGGSPPYAIVWSNGALGPFADSLHGGVYTAIATDSVGCVSDTLSVTIGGQTKPIVVLTATPTTCGLNNGTVTGSVFSGTPPYDYSWPGFGTGPVQTGLSPNTYTLRVTDAAGCSVTATATIDSSSELAATIESTPDSCSLGTGSISAQVVAGTPPYNYSWTGHNWSSPVINGLTTGTYTVWVTDSAGCTGSASGFVDSVACITPPQGKRDSVYATFCWGGIFVYGGIVYDSSGQYQQLTTPLPTVFDTTDIFVLEYPTYAFVENYTGCAGDSIVVHGLTLTTSGVFTKTFQTMNGCDSIVHITITLYDPPGSVTRMDSTCAVPVPSPYILKGANCSPDTLVITLWLGIQSEVIVNQLVCPGDPLAGHVKVDTVSLPSGCLQRVITNYSAIIPRDTIVFVDSCKALAPVVTQLLSFGGCDSLKITTIFNNTSFVIVTVPMNSCAIPDNPIVQDTIITGICDTIRVTVTTWEPTDSAQIIETCNLALAVQLPALDTIHVGLCNWRLLTAWVLVPVVENDSIQAICIGSPQDTVVTYVDSLGCLHRQRFVTVISGSVSSTLQNAVICPGEKVILGSTVFGPYEPNTVTVASVTLQTSGGCDSIVQQTVITTELPAVDITASRITCRDSLSTVTAHCAGDAEVLWSTGQMGKTTLVPAGKYFVTTTDSIGCQSFDSLTVAGYTPITVTAVTTPASCLDGATPTGSITVTVTDGIAPVAILWSTGDSSLVIDSLEAGVYSLYATDSLGCAIVQSFKVKDQGCDLWSNGTTTLWVHVGLCLVYPNRDFPVVITITNVAGTTVATFNGGSIMGEYFGAFDISALAPGMYLVTIISPDGEVRYGELIIKVNP